MTPTLMLLTSGGDAPGMNAAIRAITRTACANDWRVIGIRHGFKGLLEQQWAPLNPASVAHCIQRGGTVLKSARCPAFHDISAQQQALEHLKSQHCKGLIVIGGDGSLKGAQALAQLGDIPIMGIPASIDNDITHSDYSIGFDTARNTATGAIDRIRDTASSHDRHFLIEVMGRDSGHLALDVGIACGAELILTPEFPIPLAQIAAHLSHPKRHKQSIIMVAAEASQPGHTLTLAQHIKEKTQLDFRVCILGHVQRGGSPSTFDRLLASKMGHAAVMQLMQPQTHSNLIAYQKDQILPLPLENLTLQTRLLTEPSLLQMNAILAS